MIEALLEISDTKILGMTLTILSDNVTASESSTEIVETLIQGIGKLPLVKESKSSIESKSGPVEKKYTTRTVIKADGTYGDEIVEVTENTSGADENANLIQHKLREFCIANFDFCYSLTKAIAKLLCNLNLSKKSSKKVIVTSVIHICELLKFHQSFASNESHLIKRISDIIRMISSKQYIENDKYTFRHLLNKENAKLDIIRPSS